MRLRRLAPYLFLFPALAGLVLFKIYPILVALWQSLFRMVFLNGDKTFTGLQNYTSLFTDPTFWSSLRITLLFNVFINPIIVLLAFALAVLLNYNLKGITLFRSIQFIPVAVSIPTACVLWGIMLSPEQGVVNSILAGLGLHQQPFLTSSLQALISIIAIMVWKSVGYWSLFFWAGLQEVSLSLYEASSLDGATRWEQFLHVTYPMMKRPLTFVAVSVTVSNFLLFSPMYILTQGGPQHSTNTLMLESFNSAFLYSDSGRASAIVIILIFITLAIVAIQFRFLRAQH